MENLKELAEQNGNQAAAIMVPYHESGEIANSPLTAQYSVGVELRVGNMTFPVRQETVMDGCSSVTVNVIGQYDWDEVQAIFTNTPVLYAYMSESTYQSAPASIHVGIGTLANYITLGTERVYKSGLV